MELQTSQIVYNTSLFFQKLVIKEHSSHFNRRMEKNNVSKHVQLGMLLVCALVDGWVYNSKGILKAFDSYCFFSYGLQISVIYMITISVTV